MVRVGLTLAALAFFSIFSFGQIVNPGGGTPGSGCTTTGTSVQKGDGSGGCAPATAGTDYVIPSGTVANANNLNYINPVPVPAGGAEYDMITTASGGTQVADISGNGNPAPLCTSTNAPTPYSYGLAFLDAGSASSPYQCLTTPLSSLGAVYIAAITPTMLQTTGTAIGGIPANTYPTLLGRTGGTGGIYILGSQGLANGTVNAVQPTIFNSAGGVISTINDGFGGMHIYGFSFGTNPTLDSITIDGQVKNYGVQGSSGAVSSISGGTYVFGQSNATATFGYRGVLTYAVMYPAGTVHTVAQQQAISKYISDKMASRVTLPRYPNNEATRSVNGVFVGDSLEASYLGTSVWTAALTLNKTYSIKNYGIGGMMAFDVDKLSDQRWIQSTTVPGGFVHIWAGTNDTVYSRSATDVWASLLSIAKKAKDRGQRVILRTSVDRGGVSSSIATLNAFERANWKQTKLIDVLDDMGSLTSFAPNGTNNTGTCFNADHTHLNGPGAGTCAAYGSTTTTGYSAAQISANNAINSMDGSTEASPDFTTANTYTATYSNRYVIQTPTAAGTNVIPDCAGLSLPYTVVNASSSFTVTVSAANSASFMGSQTVAPFQTAVFNPIVMSNTAGGCSWLRGQMM